MPEIPGQAPSEMRRYVSPKIGVALQIERGDLVGILPADFRLGRYSHLNKERVVTIRNGDYEELAINDPRRNQGVVGIYVGSEPRPKEDTSKNSLFIEPKTLKVLEIWELPQVVEYYVHNDGSVVRSKYGLPFDSKFAKSLNVTAYGGVTMGEDGPILSYMEVVPNGTLRLNYSIEQAGSGNIQETYRERLINPRIKELLKV